MNNFLTERIELSEVLTAHNDPKNTYPRDITVSIFLGSFVVM